MSTPLYKSLKPNGLSTYAFPSAAEDFGQSRQNDNYKMVFSHFVLLNIPTQKLETDPKYLNFSDTTAFPRATFANIPKKPEDATFSGQLIESLRNYAANKEETLRISRTSPNSYHYDQSVIHTPSERIFFSWLKKLGVLQLEIADGPKEVTFGDTATIDKGEDWTWDIQSEYDDTEGTLTKNNRNNVKYFKEGYWYEVFWKERQVIPKKIKTSSNDTLSISTQPALPTTDLITSIIIPVEDNNINQKLFKVGDFITIKGLIKDIHKPGHPNYIALPAAALFLGYTGNEKVFKITSIIAPTNSNELLQLVIDAPDSNPQTWTAIPTYCTNESPLSVELWYEKIVQYVGEISETNNVEVANRTIEEIVAYVPEQSGSTPKVLFRTSADKNYRPGINYPFLPAQWEQREIQGAENSNNPMITNPNDYPGSYWAHFDRVDTNGAKWQYSINSGDYQKRTGDFYGVNFFDKAGNPIAVPGDEPYEIIYDSSYIDGISIDFNTKRYTDMAYVDPQFPERKARTFEEFSAIAYDGLPPKDFEFNAILWYYTASDMTTGDQAVNLYGISFVDHPDNACNAETVKEIPRIKKYAPNDNQDGSAYIGSLNLNFNIINDQLIAKYDPTSGHNIRDYMIYSEAISKLTEFNDLFVSIVQDNNVLRQEIFDLKGLIYTETDLKVLNEKLIYLESLLNLYKTIQIANSDSIETSTDVSVSPPVVKLNSIEKHWKTIDSINTSLMYDPIFATTNDYVVNVPNGRSILVEILNNDTNSLSLQNGNLIVTLDKAFQVGQYVKLRVLPFGGYENKKLDIRIINPSWNSQDVNSSQYYYLYKGLDLPIDTNTNYIVNNGDFSTTNQNNYGLIKRVPEIKDLNYSDINSIWTIITPESELVVVLNTYHGYFQPGDVVNLENFDFSHLDAGTRTHYNLNGQLPIKRVIHNTKRVDRGEIDTLLKTDPNIITNKETHIVKKTTDSIIGYLKSLVTPNIPNTLTTTDITNLENDNKFNSIFPLGCTALVFDYESNSEFERLISLISTLQDTGSNKLNADRYQIDSKNGNLTGDLALSWDSSNKIRNFSNSQPYIRFNKGFEIEIYKNANPVYVESYTYNLKPIDKINKLLQ